MVDRFYAHNREKHPIGEYVRYEDYEKLRNLVLACAKCTANTQYGEIWTGRPPLALRDVADVLRKEK